MTHMEAAMHEMAEPRPRKKKRKRRRRGKPSATADLTSAKAKEILRHGSVHGRPLSQKQQGFFGAVAGRGE